jgi:hypothetical protein
MFSDQTKKYDEANRVGRKTLERPTPEWGLSGGLDTGARTGLDSTFNIHEGSG